MAGVGETRTCALPSCEVQFTPGRKNQRYCIAAHGQKAANLRRYKALPADFRERDGLAGRLRKLDELLRTQGIDLGDLETARIERVNFWQQGYKDEHGEGQVQDLAGISISPAWESGPAWPVIQPGPAVKLSAKPDRDTLSAKPDKLRRRPPTKARNSKSWRTAVVLPDIQAGYFRGSGESLIPTHDERALSVAMQIIRETKPDVVVMHGDNADFPEFGKYRLTPSFQRTTQATIDRLTTFCAELRDAAPNAKLEWLAGNHEERLPNYVMDNAVAAFGLKRGLEPDGWPVLSVPHLLNFDTYGVTFHPGYPANEYWINDRLRVIHGKKVNSRGSTAPRYLDAERVSTLYGHVHRREWAERTRQTRHGPRTVLAASAGCLARIDGAVPSTKGGVDLDGRPLSVTEDWQQGVFVVRYKPGDQPFVVEMVSIFDGWAMHGGQEFAA